MNLIEAKVINVVQAKTRYGLKLVLNAELLKDKSKVAVWSNDLGNKAFRSKHKGDIIRLICDKDKYTLLDEEPPRNVNGAGLKSINEVLGGGSNSNGNTQQVTTSASGNIPRGAVEDYLDNDLGLPELLTDHQKQDLKKLTEERAKLLVYCIETMKKEMDAKGFEFYENSVRSLGVSLFIQITRYLP